MMMPRHFPKKKLLLCLIAISGVGAAGNNIEECDTSVEGELLCFTDTTNIPGVDSIEVPIEFREISGYYSSAMGMLPAIDGRLNHAINDLAIAAEANITENIYVTSSPFIPLTLRGFKFGLAASDASITAISTLNQAAIDSALAAFGEYELLPRVLAEADSIADGYVYDSCTNVSFVAWLGNSKTLGNHPTILHLDHDVENSDTTTFVMLIFSSYEDLTFLKVVTVDPDENGQRTHEIHLTPNTALLFDNSKVVSYETLPNDHEGPILVLVMTLTKTTDADTFPTRPLPTSRYHVDQDLLNDTLAVLEFAPVRWAHSGLIPTDGVFRLRMPDNVSPGLLQYCSELGLVELLRDHLYDNPLEMAWTNKKVTLSHEKASNNKKTVDWYIERPGEFDKFDMLFMVPSDETAHTEFLKAMAEYAGFDAVIDAVGRNFGWESAVVTHISLLAISSGDHANSHTDFNDTGGKAFNLLIPMILVEGSEPELLIDGPDVVRAQLKYQANEAVLVGDNAFHATKKIDYRDLPGKQFRFFCGIYLGDINEQNKETATPSYYKAGYPHADPNISLQNAGKHWNPNDPTKKLPRW